MKKSTFLIFIILFFCQFCTQSSGQLVQNTSMVNESEITIKNRFNPPPSYQKTAPPQNTFAHYLQNFELYPINRPVHLYNGELKGNQNAHVSVLKIDVGKRDLQQCADAVMRLRAEFLYKNKRYEDIHFNFTNGFNAEYTRWRNGKRISVNGNKVAWVSTSKNQTTDSAFNDYLQMVFAYAGTLSLNKELKNKPLNEIEIGDVFIQGGSPGHAVLVVDMAINPTTKDKVFLLAQSYMPAQEIHVLKNPQNSNLSPWYSLQDIQSMIFTPEWRFEEGDLKTW